MSYKYTLMASFAALTLMGCSTPATVTQPQPIVIHHYSSQPTQQAMPQALQPASVSVRYHDNWWNSYCRGINHDFVKVVQGQDIELDECHYSGSYKHQLSYRLEGNKLYHWYENNSYDHPRKLGDHRDINYREQGRQLLVDLSSVAPGTTEVKVRKDKYTIRINW